MPADLKSMIQSYVRKTGDTVYRNLPSGTSLSYEVIERHGDGTVTVRPITPEGYPQANPFRTSASAFSPDKVTPAKPYK